MSDRAARTSQFAYASKSEASGDGHAANEPAAREGLCRPAHPERCSAPGIAIIALAAALAATLTPAQAQFTAIYGFGDSYADTGAAPGGAAPGGAGAGPQPGQGGQPGAGGGKKDDDVIDAEYEVKK